MAKNWLYINEGKVVNIITQEETPTSDNYPGGTYDTLAQDDSQTFNVGDTFSADLQLYYNRNIWKDLSWISAEVAANLEANPPTV
jgi:hypothetical protein